MWLANAYGNAGMVYVSDEIWYVNVARKILVEVFGYHGDLLPIEAITPYYYNLEHPPLGKYIIALGIALCGDQPICWRIPGVVEATLIPVVLAWGFRFRFPEAAIASAAAAADPVLSSAGSVAMLDIHQSFFTALAIALAARGFMLPAAFVAGAALSVKLSGLPIVMAFLLWAFMRHGARTAVLAGLVSLLVYMLSWLPLAVYLGVDTVLAANIGAVSYHTMPRPADGPPVSSPLGWIANTNPFYYSIGLVTVSAVTSTLIHAAAILASFILVINEVRYKDSNTPAAIALILVYVAYYMIMIAGNTTLYSFYSVQLTPLAAWVIGEAVLDFMKTRRR